MYTNSNSNDPYDAVFIDLDQYPVHSFDVTVLLPAEFTFHIKCATSPAEAIAMVRDLAYSERSWFKPDFASLHETLGIVSWGNKRKLFTAKLSLFPVDAKAMEEKQKFYCNAHYCPLAAPVKVDISQFKFSHFKVEQLLPRPYTLDIKLAASPEEALAFARFISYACRKVRPIRNFEGLLPVPYCVKGVKKNTFLDVCVINASTVKYPSSLINEILTKTKHNLGLD